MMLNVQKHGKTGYIDSSGSVVIDFKYDFGGGFYDGLAHVGKDGERFFITEKDDIAFKNSFSGVTYFSDGLCPAAMAAKGQKKWGYIDKSGKTVIDFKFDKAHVFGSGLACVSVAGKWGVIDLTGEFVIPCKYDHIWPFVDKEPLTAFKSGPKWGVIDKKAVVVCRPKFDYVYGFNYGLAPVKIGEKWGVLNAGAEVVIEPRFTRINFSFQEKAIGAEVDGAWGVIDSFGRWIVDPRFTSIGDISSGCIAFYRGGTWHYDQYVVGGNWGLLKVNGEILVEPRFDSLRALSRDVWCVEVGDVQNLDAETGYLDKSGRVIWKPSR